MASMFNTHRGSDDTAVNESPVSVHNVDKKDSEDVALAQQQTEDLQRARTNARLADPLAGMSEQDLIDDGARVARDLDEDPKYFMQGALLAKDKKAYTTHAAFDEEAKEVLAKEISHKWTSHPKELFFVIVVNSLCAAVQGMDESVVNGAQLFYGEQFGIKGNPWLEGLVNSGPYLACFLVGCWLSPVLNRMFGRRGTIFATCFLEILCCIGQACANTWYTLFIARFCLGIGIGAKSATVPVYSSECAPAIIRGAMTMQWQMWTAFGIMIGFASDLAFFKVKDVPGITGLNWRLMMGSACLFAIVVCACVFLCPESPRYLAGKAADAKKAGDYDKVTKYGKRAYESLCRLRMHRIQAARDYYMMVKSFEAEEQAAQQRGSAVTELFKVPRNRRAMIASEITMFMQQFCGVNVIAYYSSVIFKNAGFSEQKALVASLGFGIINFLFALPAVYTIDSFGRRNLLLTTFPMMAACLLFTGLAFLISETSKAHIACVALGIYLFGIVYSPGEGPVPFTYSAEAYPLYIRTQGMSLATATTWFFNFVLAITWPKLLAAFTPTGAFCFYAAWNIVGFFLVLFFVPETKERTLEELDLVFGVSNRKMIAFGMKQLRWIMTFGRAEKPNFDDIAGIPDKNDTVLDTMHPDANESQVVSAA